MTAPPATKSTAMTDSEVSKIVAKAIRVAHTTALQCYNIAKSGKQPISCIFLLLYTGLLTTHSSTNIIQ